jgi:hypothetical protein
LGTIAGLRVIQHARAGSATVTNCVQFGDAPTRGYALSLTLTPQGEVAQTVSLNVAANQVYCVFVFDSGAIANAKAAGVPTGLPQTGQPAPTLWWVWALAGRLGLSALGGAGYLVMTPRRKVLTPVG